MLYDGIMRLAMNVIFHKLETITILSQVSQFNFIQTFLPLSRLMFCFDSVVFGLSVFAVCFTENNV